jgi:trigger factor
MAVNVETLEKLERRITLTLAATDHQLRGRVRLKRLARTVKADGFRPGKVPMSVVAQRYGYSVQYEVMNDRRPGLRRRRQRGQAARGRCAPHHAEGRRARRPDGLRRHLRGLPRGQARRPDRGRGRARVHRGDRAAIDRTVDILRKQRRTFASARCRRRACRGDRVTIDFEGKIDGEPFAGGKAEASSSSSAKARCSSSSTRPCAA